MPSFEDQISKCLSTFVSDIAELARQQAIEIFSSTLAVDGRGRRGRMGATRNGAVRSPSAPRRARSDAGNRRSPEEIDRVAESLLEVIGANPGLRVEQIGQALGTLTKDLSLPLKKLLGQHAIRSEGQRRATRYFPGARRGRGRPRTESASESASA